MKTGGIPVREHPVFSWFYETLTARSDRRGNDPMRARLVGDLGGQVLEIGAGNGLNFRYYPPAARVAAIEPDRQMLLRAVARANNARAAIALAAADGQALPFRDGTFDAVVTCLVLCTIPDASAALGEARRVLKPDGRLYFVEHVRAPGRVLAALQDVVDPLWARAFAGCHPNRDTAETLRSAGFRIEGVRSSLGGMFIRGSAVAA
jgi:ubiquinone/menaquinone biosynthesis C-methylase UbiE